MDQLKVGDVVTWRKGGKLKPGGSSIVPIGIANCKVLEIGESTDGLPAARIRLPMQMGEKEPVSAYLADLYVDD